MRNRENALCNWCGENSGETFIQGNDLLTGMPGKFQIIRCRNCGLLRQDPRLDWASLKMYYPKDYCVYEPIIETEENWFRKIDRRYGIWKRIKSIERLGSIGRLLDVGCGTGIFLGEVQRTGRWDIEGIEPIESSAIYAQETLQVKIHNLRFLDVDLTPNSYDVITMWNVLEHLEKPVDSLGCASSLLKDGGWLVFTIPNIDGWEARIFRHTWIGWDLPRHLYFFSQDEILRTLTQNGFHNIDIRCISTSHAALGLSIDFWFRATYPEEEALRKLVSRIYNSLITRLMLSIPFWILDRFKLSSLITIFAQKSEEMRANHQ